MKSRGLRLGMFLALAVSASAMLVAQHASRYVAPRTEYGQPDFQGIWKTEFLTTLERMPGATTLAVTAEEGKALAKAFLEKGPKLTDPDTEILGLNQLAKVNGEYRTSIIVDPPDGKMPLTPAGTDAITRVQTRTKEKFDNPEERSLGEQCLENFTYAPLRSIPVMLTRQVVQTREYVVISGEDIPGPRIIYLKGASRPDWQRTIGGFSVGHWEGDTLAVETTHLSATEPTRGAATRSMAIGPGTTISERFTRVSATELLYRFTVRDDALYTRPWTGEFALTRENGPIYEYACHEANYSMTNMLRGGRVQDKEAK